MKWCKFCKKETKIEFIMQIKPYELKRIQCNECKKVMSKFNNLEGKIFHYLEFLTPTEKRCGQNIE